MKLEIRDLPPLRVAFLRHVRPHEEEERTIARMLTFAAEKDLRPAGSHREIYLNDPRRIPPGSLRTILRRPVRGGP